MARKVPRPQYHRDGPSLGQDQDSEKGLTNHPGPLLNLSFFACSFLLLLLPLQQLSEVTGDTLSAGSEFPKMEHPGMTSPGEEGAVTQPKNCSLWSGSPVPHRLLGASAAAPRVPAHGTHRRGPGHPK